MKKTTFTPPSDYRYRCIDHSILQPVFRKYARAILRFVPQGLPANVITIAGFFLIVVAWLIAGDIIPVAGMFFRVGLIFLCIHLYVLLDHLDGMQAKKTGTGSPLGEFMDHYLDMINTPLIILTCYAFMPGLPVVIAVLALIGGMLSVLSMFFSQYHIGELVFGKINSDAALVLIQLYFLSLLFGGGVEFWQTTVFGYATLNTLLVVAIGSTSLFSGAGYFLKSVKTSTPDRHLPIFLIVYGYLCVVTYSGQLTPVYLAGILIPPIMYAGELLEFHVSGIRLKKPLVMYALMVVYANFFFTTTVDVNDIPHDVITMIVLFGLILVGFIKAFSRMSKHWVWINPPPTA